MVRVLLYNQRVVGLTVTLINLDKFFVPNCPRKLAGNHGLHLNPGWCQCKLDLPYGRELITKYGTIAHSNFTRS